LVRVVLGLCAARDLTRAHHVGALKCFALREARLRNAGNVQATSTHGPSTGVREGFGV
jgi:hypothetical protein